MLLAGRPANLSTYWRSVTQLRGLQEEEAVQLTAAAGSQHSP